MKIGIIGYGKIGKIRHETCLSLYPDAEFKIFDPALSNNESDNDIINWAEHVFVCTPTYFNALYTIRCLQSGKNVFCEKPPALNYDSLKLVEEEYLKHPDLTLVYGFNHRQYDSIQKMKEIIDSNDMGRILWMRGRYGKAMGDPNNNGWRSNPLLSGGGILIDQGIHMLDLMLYFSGGFDTVQSIVTNNMWNIDDIEDNVFLNLYNSNKNISASLHSTMIEWRHIFSLEVLLENGYIALNGLKTPSGSYGKEVLTICEDKHNTKDTSKSTMIEFKDNTSWEKELKIFFDASLGTPTTNLPQALQVMSIIKEAYRGR